MICGLRMTPVPTPLRSCKANEARRSEFATRTMKRLVLISSKYCNQQRSFHFRHRAHPAITPRATNFSQWYLDVISSADLAEASPVKVLSFLMNCLSERSRSPFALNFERDFCYRAAISSSQTHARCGTTFAPRSMRGCGRWGTPTCAK
jgi:hypothetical protein